MTISTLLLILLLTLGAASALDRFVRSHWLLEALTALETLGMRWRLGKGLQHLFPSGGQPE
jgi:hypothetical protein